MIYGVETCRGSKIINNYYFIVIYYGSNLLWCGCKDSYNCIGCVASHWKEK